MKTALKSICFSLILFISACQGGAPSATPTPTATATAAFTATPEATPDPFFLGGGTLKSGDGQTEVALQFINNTDGLILVNWVDSAGQEQPFTQVESHTSITQGTYNTHAWVLRDENNNVVVQIIATDEQLQVFEIGADGKVVYQNEIVFEPTPIPAPTFGPAVAIDERAYNDRPDDNPGLYQVHFLYVLPKDAADQQRDLDGKINKTIDVVNSWFAEQSGGSKIRFDTYQGQLDITFIQMDMTSAEFYDASVANYGGAYWIRDVLEEKLLEMNLFQPGKIYVSLLEIDKHPSTCADAAHPPDLMGRLAGLYPSAVVEAGWNCADEAFGAGLTYTDMGVIHEIVHLLGFASSCGKNPTSAENISHTGDFNNDLMWAPDSTSTESWDTDHMQLDPGNDDYFKHSIPNCADLVNSAFLDPLPANPETPPGWPADWKLP